MTPFLITGCGRSGTAWAARLFTELGFPCTHEGQFNLTEHGPLVGGESSWMAMPYLDSLAASARILRIMRDPYDVVRSAVTRGFLADTSGPYERFAIRHCRHIGAGRDHLGRVIRWVALWDAPLWDQKVHGLHAADDARDVRLAVKRATGDRCLTDEKVADALDAIGTTTNTNPGFPIGRHLPAREDVDVHPDGALIRRRAEQYGYL